MHIRIDTVNKFILAEDGRWDDKLTPEEFEWVRSCDPYPGVQVPVRAYPVYSGDRITTVRTLEYMGYKIWGSSRIGTFLMRVKDAKVEKAFVRRE